MAGKAADLSPEAIAARKAANARQNAPRACYVIVRGDTSNIDIVSSTRKAEEALEAVDSDDTLSYLRLMVK